MAKAGKKDILTEDLFNSNGDSKVNTELLTEQTNTEEDEKISNQQEVIKEETETIDSVVEEKPIDIVKPIEAKVQTKSIGTRGKTEEDLYQ